MILENTDSNFEAITILLSLLQTGTYRFTTIVGAIAGSYDGLKIHSDAAPERLKLDEVVLKLRHARTK